MDTVIIVLLSVVIVFFVFFTFVFVASFVRFMQQKKKAKRNVEALRNLFYNSK